MENTNVDPVKTIKKIFSSKIVFFIVCLLVYSSVFFNQFVWDDNSFIIRNTQVHSINFYYVFFKSVFNSAGYYRPLPEFYFSILYTLFQKNPFFYHTIQIILHACNGLLVFVILKKFLNKRLALFLALLFIVNPINQESVGYIGATVSPLQFLFGGLAIFIAIKEAKGKWGSVGIFILLLLSFLTKESSFVYVLFIIGYALFINKKNWVSSVSAAILSFAAYLIIRFSTVHALLLSKANYIPIMRQSFFDRLFNIPAIIFYYLSAMTIPVKASINQTWVITEISIGNFYIPLIVDIAFFGLLIALGINLYKKKNKLFRLYMLFFIVFLVAFFSYFQLTPLDMTVADRWFYTPFFLLLATLGIGLSPILRNVQKGMLYTAAGFLLILFSLQTMIRNTQWYDTLTLYSHDFSVWPSDNGALLEELGSAYLQDGNYAKAKEFLLKSVSISSNFSNVNDLGVVYQHEGDLLKAKKYYEKAMSLHPQTTAPYVNYAAFCVFHDSPELAIPVLQNILIKQYPNVSRFWVLLAVADYRTGKFDEAFHAANNAYTFSANLQTLYLLNVTQQKGPIQNLDITRLE